MAQRRIEQHQVADGMVVNVPWGTPIEQWSDRMIERGVRYLDGSLEKAPDGEGRTFFPNLFHSLTEEAASRGIIVN
jgi:hypothetical protein